LFVRLEAKPGREEDVASLLRNAQATVEEEEPLTTTWFALRFGPSSFGIFDAFAGEEGRQEHLGGSVAAALSEKAPELFAQAPVIERLDVIAYKLPGDLAQREVSAA
jgi:quinol monooxygenase YgiN